ncbi:hypothetical protein GJ496_000054 [Pomphorhynchus laevis]|nr:hypothetical protein GJ496_000054 [Pomphorhynchus laevis]
MRNKLLRNAAEKTPTSKIKKAVNFIRAGKIGKALRLIQEEEYSNILNVNSDVNGKSVWQHLKEMHPNGSHIDHEFTLHSKIDGCIEHNNVRYFSLNDSDIIKAARRTHGSAGPSGVDADAWRSFLMAFGSESRCLINVLRDFVVKIATEVLDSKDLCAYTRAYGAFIRQRFPHITKPDKGFRRTNTKIHMQQINRDKKCEDFREFLRLNDYGLQMPTNIRGLAPSQLKDLNLTNDWACGYEPSGGYNYNADPLLERNGEVDSTLVKLKNCQTSYINANFVGYKPANRSYILTQGHLSNTISHYWNMVWQENVRSIIMLNKLVEKGRSKCFQYFTMECTMEKILIDGLTEEDTAIMRLNDVDMTVELQSGIHDDSFVKRNLKILKSNTGETRDIHHYNYTDLPDFGEPSCPENFLRFLSILRSQHAFEHSPVIYCSAGIGRSGTFAFVDIVLILLAASEGCNSHVQLMNILHHLRNQRPGLVQTPEQPRFSAARLFTAAAGQSLVAAAVRSIIAAEARSFIAEAVTTLVAADVLSFIAAVVQLFTEARSLTAVAWRSSFAGVSRSFTEAATRSLVTAAVQSIIAAVVRYFLQWQLDYIQIIANRVKNNYSLQCNEVNLNNNLFHQVHDLTRMLSGVKYLRLDYNLIENVYPLFAPSNNLHVLSLKGNRIRHFYIESYTINWLTYLDLSNNILSTVKILNRRDLELRLTGNPNDFELECNTQLTDLRFNRLQSHQVSRKKILTAILLLDYNLLNDLQFLSDETHLRYLKSLSCSHNLIRTINENFFAFATILEKLLSHVKIDSTTTNGKITTQSRRYPRNCCIIFHNVPESKSSLLAERITYDRTFILEQLHQLMKGKLLNISYKLVKVLRLRRKESPTSVKSRLLKAVFESSEHALMMLGFRFEPHTNDIKIYPDLSPKDVLRHRAARYELAKRAQFTNRREVTSNYAVTSTTSTDDESNEVTCQNYKYDTLKHIMNKICSLQLCAHQYHLDILLIVETWISSSSVDSAHIPGYYMFSAHRTDKSGFGVATYVNSHASLNPALLESFVSKDLEILVVKLSKNNGRRISRLVISNVYRHPIGCKETAFRILTSLLIRLQEKHKHILMSCDFNMLDLGIVTRELGFFQLAKFLTRGNAILDKIYTKSEAYFTEVTNGSPLGESDYCGLLIFPRQYSKRYTICIHVVYDRREQHIIRYKNSCAAGLAAVGSDSVWNLEELSKLVETCINMCIPECIVCITSCDPTWMSPLIKSLQEEKDKAYRSNNLTNYNYLKQKISIMIDGSRKTVFHDLSAKNSPLHFGNVLKNLRCNPTTSSFDQLCES